MLAPSSAPTQGSWVEEGNSPPLGDIEVPAPFGVHEAWACSIGRRARSHRARRVVGPPGLGGLGKRYSEVDERRSTSFPGWGGGRLEKALDFGHANQIRSAADAKLAAEL
jgi:hypothetical protein